MDAKSQAEREKWFPQVIPIGDHGEIILNSDGSIVINGADFKQVEEQRQRSMSIQENSLFNYGAQRRRKTLCCDECECTFAFLGKSEMETPDILYIAPSPLHGYGVFANVTLEPGLVVGPYKGEKIYSTDNTDYAWTIYSDDGESQPWMIDAFNLHSSNYMRYINDPFGSGKPANLVHMQSTDRVFYLVYERIEKDEELLVSYGDTYWISRGYAEKVVEEPHNPIEVGEDQIFENSEGNQSEACAQPSS